MTDAIAPSPRSPETWARIREAYLQGTAASTLCERFGVGLRTLRDRARQEGWRRSDQPEPDLVNLDLAQDDDEDEEDATPATAAELQAQAWRQVSRAIRRGRSAEARRWMALHAQFDALAKQERRACVPIPPPAEFPQRLPDETFLAWADRLASERDRHAAQSRKYRDDLIRAEAGIDDAVLPPPESGDAGQPEPHPPHGPHPEISSPDPKAEQRRLLEERLASRQADRLPYNDILAQLHRLDRR